MPVQVLVTVNQHWRVDQNHKELESEKRRVEDEYRKIIALFLTQNLAK